MITKQGDYCISVKGSCKTSLGKRKVQDVDQGHPCTISATVVSGFGAEVHANVWIQDDEGRTFAAVFTEEFLRELSEAFHAVKRPCA